MKFRVDIVGDSSAATTGAAALAAMAAAGRSAAAALGQVGRQEAALGGMGKSAEELAAGIKDAQGEASRLKAAQAALATGGDSVDIAAYQAPSTQIKTATDKAAALALELQKTGRAGDDFAGIEARRKASLAAMKAKQAEDAKREENARRAEAAEKKADKTQRELVGAVKLGAAETANAASGIVRYAAALAGIGSIGALTQLAIGWRGMAALQMISMRATMDVRRLFTGLDSAPLIRAADKLERNLSRSSVTGNALSGILQRSFGALFGLLERGEPLVQAVFEGMLIGALEAEIALLKARIALAPLTVAIEDWLGSEDAMEDAAIAGAAALGALAIAAGVAAAPFIAAAAAVGALIDQLRKLANESLPEWSDIQRLQTRNFSPELADANADEAGRRAYDENQARIAAQQGHNNGDAMADGVMAGLDAQQAALKAAGGRAADAVNEGMRQKAGIHSPSTMTRYNAEMMGEGAVEGLDEAAPKVQAAADKALVPKMDGKGRSGGSGASAAGGPVGPVTLTVTNENHFHGGAPSREDLEAANARNLQNMLRQLALMLGVPIPVPS